MNAGVEEGNVPAVEGEIDGRQDFPPAGDAGWSVTDKEGTV